MTPSLRLKAIVQKTLDDGEKFIVVEFAAAVCSAMHHFKTNGQIELLILAVQFV